MYRSFRVKNFRCFKDLQINDLGRVNLIAGKNNTGKTALMEAMYILAGNRHLKTILREDSRFYSSGDNLDGDGHSSKTWNKVFFNFRSDQLIEMSAKILSQQVALFEEVAESSVKISVKDHAANDYVSLLERFELQSIDLYHETELLEIAPSYDRPMYMLALRRKIRASRIAKKALIKSRFVSAGGTHGAREIQSQYGEVSQDPKRMSQLIDTLGIVEPRLEDLRIVPDGLDFKVYLELGLNQLVPMASMGEALKRLQSVVLEMFDLGNGVIFIDEIENGIHHSVQKKVWQAIGKLARDLDIQIFATTHSLEMIRAAYEAFKDDDSYEFRYHRLDRTPDGNIEAVTYNEFVIESAMSTNWEVRG